jgi:hypothetical protein
MDMDDYEKFGKFLINKLIDIEIMSSHLNEPFELNLRRNIDWLAKRIFSYFELHHTPINYNREIIEKMKEIYNKGN